MLNFTNGGAGTEQSDSIAFYNRLRDDVAGRLIKKYGRTGTLRQDSGSYDPATGTQTESFTDTSIKVVILPNRGIRGGMAQGYSDDVVVKSDVGLLISVKETRAANVIPKINDVITLAGDRLRIDVISSVSPGGTDVIYKVGASRG